MATSRPRNGGPSAPIRFEDFHPTSERLAEEGAEILTIYLPAGFEKEQIKITYVHTTRIIRVQGERSMGNNVWGRFNETFPVPQNCVVNKISGKLQDGVLTITMPKQVMTPLIISPRVDVRPSEPPKETRPSEPPKTGSDPIRPSKDQQPKPTEPPKTGADPIRPSKDQQGHRPIEPPLHPKPAAPKPKVTSSTTTPVKAKDDDKTVLSEPRRKIIASHEKESSRRRKELVISDAALEKKEKRGDKVKETKDSLLRKVKEMKKVSMRGMKELSFELTEERRALLNAGVAVLVIVALGAYITYSIKSSGNTKN